MSNGHLTKEQMLRVAVGSILNGIDQHVLAELMGTNQGRINEAIKVVEYALENKRDVYAVTQGKASIVFKGAKETNYGTD